MDSFTSPSSRSLPADIAETHSAVIVFLGDRAYKMKKAVDLGFLDFSTVAARAEACENEVALNRRLAPDVYLGVLAVQGLDGTPCEHLVVMRRLPADRKLAACLRRGEDVQGAVRAVAREVAVLHATPSTARVLNEVATAEAVRRNWTDGFDQLAPFVGTVIDVATQEQIEHLALRYLAGRGPLFRRRIEGGHICDGHGDLQAEDIFILDDGPRVLDCLDFDPRLRWGDALLDVAFLAMDLERLGHARVATAFLTDYREFAAENWPATLAHHYIAYRAHVRAKVAVLRSAQTGEPVAGIDELQRLCRDHLEAARVRLIIVGGLPGTGKTTIARQLGDLAGAVVLRTDEIRRQMPERHLAGDKDRYASAAVDAVYQETLRRAEELLGLGENVVIDATWSAARHRDEARVVAARSTSELTQIECRAPRDLCERRIGKRAATGLDPSEATPAVAIAMAQRFDAWPEATIVSTDTSIETAVDSASAAAGLAVR